MEKTFIANTQFNYQSYLSLTDVIGNTLKTASGDDLEDAKLEQDIVVSAIDACSTYVKTVDDGEAYIRFCYAALEGKALRVAVENADRSRRLAHDAAISNIAILNRTAKRHGMPPVFLGDVHDRLQVADFCLEVTVRLFQERRS